MQFNLSQKLEKIAAAFSKIQKLPKALLKYGFMLFLIILSAGSIMALVNITVLNYNPFLDLVSKSLVKTSFSIAAEAIIGALIIDYVFKK